MTTCTTNTCIAVRAETPRGGILERIAVYIEVRRQRRQLAALDNNLLRDVGLTREEADLEVRRKLWDVPGHWLR